MWMNLHNGTRRAAVVGHPISHTLSPRLHNGWIQALGIDGVYLALRVTPDALPQLRAAADILELVGMNVTMPHKVAILEQVDELDEWAGRLRSVNTIAIRDGRWVGSSTDAPGLAWSMRRHDVEYAGRDVLFLGAGGVTRVLALHAAVSGARSIAILNRTPARADEIAAMVRAQTGKSVRTGSLAPSDLTRHTARSTLIVQTTPLGMHGVEDSFPDLSFLGIAPRGCAAVDLIYNPLETAFLRVAREKGMTAIGGLGMLVGQARLAFEAMWGVALEERYADAALEALERAHR